jgi:hypothetical protein
MNDADDLKTRQMIAAMTDPAALRQFMKNANAKKREDLYWLAFKRLCEVQATHDPSDPIVWRLERSIRASEEVRGVKYASYTHRMMKNRGAVGTTKKWLTYRNPTPGYVALVEAGHWDLLGEAIPLDFPERFTERELEVARYRVADAKQGRVSEPFLPALQPNQ